MEKKKKHVAAATTVYTASYLHAASRQALEEAKDNEKGSYYNLMISLVFSAFTIEAYLNHLGAEIIPFWLTIERSLSPSKKLEVIAVQLSKSIDYGRRPFQSFKSIFQLRDFLAHGRTEYISKESIQFLSDGDKPELPQAEWQKDITAEIVQRYFDDTEEIIKYLHDVSGVKGINPLLVPEISDWRITPVSSDGEV